MIESVKNTIAIYLCCWNRFVFDHLSEIISLIINYKTELAYLQNGTFRFLAYVFLALFIYSVHVF